MRQTSIDAYNSIRDSGALGTLRWKVYDYIFNHGPVSMMEANLALNDDKYSNGSYTSRFAELRHAGVIHEVGKHKCPHTGRTATLWDVTGRLPRILTKREVILEKIEAAKAKLARVEQELLDFDMGNT